MLCKRPILKPLQNGMDGTGIIRAVELNQGKFVGKQFPPNVRLFSAQLVETILLRNMCLKYGDKMGTQYNVSQY